MTLVLFDNDTYISGTITLNQWVSWISMTPAVMVEADEENLVLYNWEYASYACILQCSGWTDITVIISMSCEARLRKVNVSVQSCESPKDYRQELSAFLLPFCFCCLPSPIIQTILAFFIFFFSRFYNLKAEIIRHCIICSIFMGPATI